MNTSSSTLRHVLVTGGAVRIGREISLTLARAGWDVTIHAYKSREQAESLADEIRQMGRQARAVYADLSQREETERLIPLLGGPPLTALVNNACLFERNESDPDGSRHRSVNNEAPRLLTEALYNQLADNVEGSVVHLLDSTRMPDFLSAYADSRQSLRDDIERLAKSYAPRLRLNAVAPGPTLIGSRQSTEHFEKLASQTPLHRASTSEDVAQAVRFLLENNSVLGQILCVDCGAHLNS